MIKNKPIESIPTVERPTQRNKQRLVSGLILSGWGVLVIFYPGILPREIRFITLFSPILVALGYISFRRELCGRACSEPWLLAMGLLMLAIGGYPWLYTPYLTGDQPGGEGAGMLGTLIFIFVGLPGLAFAGAALVRILKNRQ